MSHAFSALDTALNYCNKISCMLWIDSDQPSTSVWIPWAYSTVYHQWNLYEEKQQNLCSSVGD